MDEGELDQPSRLCQKDAVKLQPAPGLERERASETQRLVKTQGCCQNANQTITVHYWLKREHAHYQSRGGGERAKPILPLKCC